MAEQPAPKKPKASPKVWRFYKLEDGKISKLRRECPRCGKGYFLAEHQERSSCGHCGYTLFKRKQ